jgi:small subunit ribosomal protein S1
MRIEDIEIGEDENFAAMFEASEKKAETNEVVDGVIVAINDDAVLVDVKQGVEGKLNISEITKNGEVAYKIGDTIQVMISGFRGERPSISHQKVLQKELVDAFIAKHGEEPEDVIINGTVTFVKRRAGFTVKDDEGMEYFMPMGHGYLKADNAMGKKVEAKVIKVNKEQNSIVVSRKVLIENKKAIKEETINKLMADNNPVVGTVKKITSYGMFIDLGGIDGLCNYNEISYKGPVNPSSYYKEGDNVEVKVLNYDKEKGHISLSIKACLPNPWEEMRDQLETGDTIGVTVSNFESYGAFVDLGNDVEGLLHISEISWNKNLKNPKDVLNIGDEINVQVIELDANKKRLRVSLKALQPKPFAQFTSTHKAGDTMTGKVVTITDFGAFVNLGEVDGLLHNEEASWEANTTCKDLYKKGDEVEVKIIKIDADKENISLSTKALSESPVKKFQNENPVGTIVKGTIKDFKDFGMFVKLNDTIDALVRTEDFGPFNKEEANVGDEIEAVITNIDVNRNKIRLSIKRLESQQERELLKTVNDDEAMTFGDLLKDQLKK